MCEIITYVVISYTETANPLKVVECCIRNSVSRSKVKDTLSTTIFDPTNVVEIKAKLLCRKITLSNTTDSIKCSVIKVPGKVLY